MLLIGPLAASIPSLARATGTAFALIFNFRPRSEVQGPRDMTFGMGFSTPVDKLQYWFSLQSLIFWSKYAGPVSDQVVDLHGRVCVEIIPEGLFQYRLTSFRVAPSVQLRSGRLVPLCPTRVHTHTRAYRRSLFARRPPPKFFQTLKTFSRECAMPSSKHVLL